AAQRLRQRFRDGPVLASRPRGAGRSSSQDADSMIPGDPTPDTAEPPDAPGAGDELAERAAAKPSTWLASREGLLPDGPVQPATPPRSSHSAPAEFEATRPISFGLAARTRVAPGSGSRARAAPRDSPPPAPTGLRRSAVACCR